MLAATREFKVYERAMKHLGAVCRKPTHAEQERTLRLACDLLLWQLEHGHTLASIKSMIADSDVKSVGNYDLKRKQKQTGEEIR